MTPQAIKRIAVKKNCEELQRIAVKKLKELKRIAGRKKL